MLACPTFYSNTHCSGFFRSVSFVRLTTFRPHRRSAVLQNTLTRPTVTDRAAWSVCWSVCHDRETLLCRTGLFRFKWEFDLTSPAKSAERATIGRWVRPWTPI